MPTFTDDYGLDDGASLDASFSDPTLLKLNEPSFDAVSFLNDNLPSLNISSAPQLGVEGGKVAQIQDASMQLHALLTKINAHHVRSSSQLSQLSDDILRSGNRLAYEVEVLRGDANSLYEVLTERLRSDVNQFVSDQIADHPASVGTDIARNAVDPDFILQLRMLGQIKTRLEDVINVFGEAMKWSLPSQASVVPSLISVSAPELAMMETTDQDEDNGEAAKNYRAEITNLLDSDGGGYAGLEAAIQKVEQLRLLCTVWRGTTEERTRVKFVDTLSKLVEERKRLLDDRASSQGVRVNSSTQRSNSISSRPVVAERSEKKVPTEPSNAAGSLFRNLQKLRDDIYLD